MPPDRPREKQEQAKETHIDDFVAQSRLSIGDLNKDVRKEGEWDDRSIAQDMEEFRSNNKTISLIRVYDQNADADRQVALRIVAMAQKEGNRPLTEAERNEVLAAQLRITLMETLSRALDAYMDIIEQYKSYKEAGMRAPLGDEAVVFRHLQMVRQIAEQRVALAVDRIRGQAAPNYSAKAQQLDNELLRLLSMRDKDIPGYKEHGTATLPAYDLMLSMLNDEYRKTFDAYKEKIKGEGGGEVERKVENATQLIAKRFPGKQPEDVDGKEVDGMLRREMRGYTLDQYLQDCDLLERKNRSFASLDSRGKETVQRLSDLNSAMGRYQVNRVTLASIRHHFDQGYTTSSASKPERGSPTDPTTAEATRKFLENQQHGALRGLDRHLEQVDAHVLKIGFAEKSETLWNTKGRLLVTRIADAIATLETSWIPDIPGLQEGFLRNSARESLLNGELMEDALGWPRDSKGNLVHYGDLTESQRITLETKQDSIEKAILRFRETGVLRNMQESVSAAKILVSRKDLAAERFLDTKPIDAASLPPDRIHEKNLDQMIAKHTAPVVYKMLFLQLQGDWDIYSEEYSVLLGDFHGVINKHFDASRFLRGFADGQKGISYLLIALAVGGGLAFYELSKFASRKVWRAARNVGRASVEPRTAKPVVEPKSAPPKPTSPPPKPKAPTVPASPPSVPATGTVAPAAKIGEELTKVRYMTQWEKHLAESLEKTRALQKFRAFQNMKGVKIGGRLIRYGAGVAIPALAAAEIISNEQRARGAVNNPQLQKEHRDNHTTAILEAAGVGLTLSSRVPFLKALYLGAAVVNTANYRRKRTAVREDWARETDDFLRDFDAPGLLEEIRTKTLGHTVEGGAGSALYPRIALPSKADNAEALKAADEATRGTRWRAYEAYFTQNLSPDLTAAERTALIRDKTQYIGLLSQRDFNRLSHKELEDADLFAELQQRRRAMEQAGQEPIFTYEEDGQVRTIDLRKLTPGASTAEEIRRIVSEYATVIKPMEDLLKYEALGKVGEPRLIREQLIEKLIHSIHDTERHIREVDWPGVDTWVSSGQSQSENIARAYIAMHIGDVIDPLSKRLGQGEASIEEYTKALDSCHSLMQTLLNAPNADAYLTKAQIDMGDERCKRAASRKAYHILEFLVSK